MSGSGLTEKQILTSADHPLCLAMSVLNAALAAKSLGIGSCILTPRGSECSKILKVGNGSTLTLLLAVGYEKKGAYQKKREKKPLEKLVFYEKFGSRKKPKK